ncbi:hypothetical protein NBRC111894_2246 [Sporolactobacillus inulinus]|uniref:Uncharacterized protein n=1 Tax=Sporolactobacillus inulinus TaxID=2078 RepID=A0A4Y1ZC68_9BACL|nr:hypothetical protein NBRC111894_2246 [Sporolactobacillus inulinus]
MEKAPCYPLAFLKPIRCRYAMVNVDPGLASVVSIATPQIAALGSSAPF